MKRMKNIKDKVRFSCDWDSIVDILDENLDLYIETLKEANKRGSYRGWAYNKETLDKYRYAESEDLEKHKKKLIILDDLVPLGYINLTMGDLYDDNGIIRDDYSIYTISEKGKDFLKRIKELLEEPSK